MTEDFRLIRPKIIPPLDNEFRPAVLANHAYLASQDNQGVPLVIGLERESGKFSRFETRVFPENHPKSLDNLYFSERLIKFLLWQRGGYRVVIGGPSPIGDHIKSVYSDYGKRHFDYHFMGDQVYEKPFLVEICNPSENPSC
jgi:hypothetical protein